MTTHDTTYPSTLRANHVRRLQSETFDVLVLGAGINGAVAAAASSGKGARVALIDKGDFASVTSQESSNLAWGGIKYLESYEFGLVWKLCKSRNELMRAYPSTVKEIRFFTSIAKGFRKPRILVFMGALLYWLMGRCFTRRPRLLSRKDIARDEAVVRTEGTIGGIEYSDAYLHDNDARFVFNFVRAAMTHGCTAANYVRAEHATFDADAGSDGLWTVEVRDEITGASFALRARSVVNACGPYVDVVNQRAAVRTEHEHLLSKGIHLIVKRLTESQRVLTFFADDGRLFFAIPMGPCTCIGTTDTRVQTPTPEVTAEDRAFVLDNINKRLLLPRPLTEEDIIAERCGVRPLAVRKRQGGAAGTDMGDDTDWVQLSRKHVIEVDASRRYLSIFGGKLTDCVNVGDEVTTFLAGLGTEFLKPRHRWYGEPSAEKRAEFMGAAKAMGLDAMTSPASSEPLSARLWRRYGADAFVMLRRIQADPKQAEVLIAEAEYLRCEIEHAAAHEMVTKLEDFLRRRSKIALVRSRDVLERAEGVHEACRIFFGEGADAAWSEYFGVPSPASRRHSAAAPRKMVAGSLQASSK